MSKPLSQIEFSGTVNSGLLDAALVIANRRAEKMRQMRECLVRGDDAAVLELARELCDVKEAVVHRLAA